MRQVTITLPAGQVQSLDRRSLYADAHEAAALLLGTTGDSVDLTHEIEKDGELSMTFVPVPSRARRLTLVGAA